MKDIDTIKKTSLPGTLVQIFGSGVLILGEADSGKSSVALNLIQKRHQLIVDDLVEIKQEFSGLTGFFSDKIQHYMEIKDIGILNILRLYGPACVLLKTAIEFVVFLGKTEMSRAQLSDKQKFYQILDRKLPLYFLSGKKCEQDALLIETIVLSRRLQDLGYQADKELGRKLDQIRGGFCETC